MTRRHAETPIHVGKEIWKDIPGYEGYYQVSNCGRVRSLDREVPGCYGTSQIKRGKILKHDVVRSGYHHIRLCKLGIKEGWYVHRLVALAFIGPRRDGMHCAHNDGRPDNNCVENLRYCTPSENNADKLRHGTHQAGEFHGRAILNEGQVREIRDAAKRGVRIATLARRYGIGWQTANHIIKGTTWRVRNDGSRITF